MTLKKNLNLPVVILFSLALLLVIVAYSWIPKAKELPYHFQMSWGEEGTAAGQFHDPTGVAVTSNEVFVSDARNGRIQVFNHAGNFLREFGEPGEELGQLGRPMNLAIHNKQLYVPEYFNDRIQVFSLNGISQGSIGKPSEGPGEFNAPGGVAVADNGDLFVADFYNQRIQHLKSDGSFIEQWGTTGKVGIAPSEFNYPTDVALADDQTLFAADGYNDRVQVFSATGDFLHKWGGPLAFNIKGSFNGWFKTVSSIAVGPKGNIFTADFYNNRIQKFAADGTFLVSFGEAGGGPGEMIHPVGVAVANDGTVFVADFGNNRMQKWRQ